MAGDPLVECSFFIPIRRDAKLSDGDLHSAEAWEWLDDELDLRFAGRSRTEGVYEGFYRDPNTGERVNDLSHRYVVAAPAEMIDELRSLLSAACVIFQQKCVYLSVAGKVEFVSRA